jgi:hypothetical protein
LKTFQKTWRIVSMKNILLASACIFALSSGAAMAQQQSAPGAVQSQPAPGASGQGEVGPNAKNGMKPNTTTGASGMRDKAGDSKGSTATGRGANTNNMENTAGGGAGGAGGGAGGAGGGAGGK